MLLKFPKGIVYWLLVSSVSLAWSQGNQVPDSENDTDSMEALLQEVEAGLEEWDLAEKADESLASLTPSPIKWNSRSAVGGGYADNVLRGHDPVGSYFYRVEADTSFAWTPHPDAFRLSGFLYGEANQFERDLDVDGERILMGQLRFADFNPSSVLGAEISYLFGDQVFDVSSDYTVTEETGRLIQHRAAVAAFYEYYLTGRDVIEFHWKTGRGEYSDEINNLWFTHPSVRYTRIWGTRLETLIEVGYQYQVYDRDLARSGNGFSEAGRELRTDIFMTEFSVRWQPVENWPLDITLESELSYDNDNGGGYEDRISRMVGVSLFWDPGFWEFNLGGRVRTYEYEDRTTTFLSEMRLYQQADSAYLDIRRKLPHDYYLNLSLSWSRFYSRLEEDRYRAREVYLLLGRSF